MAKTNFQKVQDFMKAMEQPLAQGFECDNLKLGVSLITEEWVELIFEVIARSEFLQPTEKQAFIHSLLNDILSP